MSISPPCTNAGPTWAQKTCYSDAIETVNTGENGCEWNRRRRKSSRENGGGLKSKSDSTLAEKGNKVQQQSVALATHAEGTKEKYNVGRQKRMDEKTGSMLGELHGEK